MAATTTRPRRIAPVAHDPEALRWARERSGLTQRALAELAGISPSLLCEAEKGTRSLGADHRKVLAEHLNCPVSVLERKVVA